MELLVRTNNYLERQEILHFDALGVKSSHLPAKALPYSIIISNPTLAIYHSFFQYISNISTKIIGSASLRGDFLQTVLITPKIKRNLLLKYSQVGWGDIKVAILDSGYSGNISIIAEKDFTGTGTIDRLGHGTRISRIIKHLAPAAKLLIGKIGDTYPEEAALIPAIEWAVNQGAQIINISSGFGANKCLGDCILAKLINKIVNDTGCIFTVAMGNNGPRQNTINCPACATHAVSVGAIDAHGNLAKYSSRGIIGSCKPNILAPGEVTIDYKTNSGTSYSAPIIASILAATLNKFHKPQDAVAVLYLTAKKLFWSHPFEQGCGVVNLQNYMEALNDGKTHSGSQEQKKGS